MLLPRKNRQPLLRKNREDETYPSLMVSLDETPTPDNVYEISILDINAAGMGIASSVPLNVGQHMFFDSNQPEWELPSYGIVVWTFQDSDGFRAGVKFA